MTQGKKVKNVATQTDFAKRIGTTRGYVNGLIKDNKLAVIGTDVDLDNASAKYYIKRAKERGVGSDADAQRKQEDRAERRALLEIKKLEQQGMNLDIKNRQLRGKLRDAALVDSAFFELLQAALDSFRASVPADLDEIIAAAIEKGFDSRAESLSMIHASQEDIAEDIRNQWAKKVRSWKSTAVVMRGQDNLSRD
jgi:hypothetical protein